MLQPVGNHVLVKPLSKEEVTKSGILLPDSAQQKPQEGTVIALGHGKYVGEKLISFEEMGVTVGSVVMYTKYGPTEIKIENEDYFILDSDDIIGIVK